MIELYKVIGSAGVDQGREISSIGFHPDGGAAGGRRPAEGRDENPLLMEWVQSGVTRAVRASWGCCRRVFAFARRIYGRRVLGAVWVRVLDA